VVVLVLASAAVRAAYFVELNAGPVIALHRCAECDMSYYDGWGRAIANGDWRSESVGVPMHSWHNDVADRFFAQHPDARTALNERTAGDKAPSTPAAQLWSQWNGQHQFYQDPLYPYMVGVTYWIFGPDPRFVLAWQLALGVLSNVLIYVLARRYFGELAGAAAAALALLCAPLLSYELLLLRDSTIVFAGLGLVWLADLALTRQRWIWFAALGLSLGLAMLLKSTFLLFAALLVAAIAWQYRRRHRDLLIVAGALAAGLAVPLAPVAARNVMLGVPAMAWAGSGTLTFVSSSDINYPATGGFYVDDARVAEVMGRTNGRFLPAAFEILRTHTPATLAALVWHKVDNVWRWYEIPNMVSFYYMRRFAPVLAWLPVTFYVLAPFALVGLVVGLRQAHEAWPLYALVLCLFASLVGFLVLGRLRAALMAALIPFAAMTFVTLLRARMSTKIATAASVALLMLWTGRPLADGVPLIPTSDWLTPFVVQYQDQIKRALDSNDRAGAAAAYGELLSYGPDFSEMPSSGGVLANASDRDLARTFAEIHAVVSELLRSLGRKDEANAQIERARALLSLAGTPVRD
jgi:dolichyl-phosphate-mannose-protein mannosyltransferase